MIDVVGEKYEIIKIVNNSHIEIETIDCSDFSTSSIVF